MAVYRIPIVLDVDGSNHIKLPDGAVLNTDSIPLDPNGANLLSATPDGLLLLADLLVSTEGNNVLRVGADGKLVAEGLGDLSDLLSQNAGNSLQVINGKLYVNVPDGIDLTDYVSSAGDNALQIVNDKLYLSLDAYLEEAPVDGKTYVRNSGSWVEMTILDATTGGLKIDPSDQVLLEGLDGIKSSVNLLYDQPSNTLQLVGKNSQIISSISLIDNQLLESVTVETNPSGQPAGSYLVMTFKLDDGTTSTTYVDLSQFITVYTAGNAGVKIQNFVISAVTDTAKGITVGANGITTATGYNLMTDAERTKLANVPASSKNYTPANAAVTVDNTAATIGAVVDTAKGLAIAASVGITLATGYQLMTAADKTKLDGVMAGAKAYTSGNGGIVINAAASTISAAVDTSKGLAMSPTSGISLAAGYNLMTDAERTKLAGVTAGAKPYTSGNGAVTVNNTNATVSGVVDMAAGLAINATSGITLASGRQIPTTAQVSKIDSLPANAVGDAPSNGGNYVRRNGAWVDISGSLGGGSSGISSIGYTQSGSGSVVTNVTASGSTVAVTKGNVTPAISIINSGGGNAVSGLNYANGVMTVLKNINAIDQINVTGGFVSGSTIRCGVPATGLRVKAAWWILFLKDDSTGILTRIEGGGGIKTITDRYFPSFPIPSGQSPAFSCCWSFDLHD